jgi:hypothetical protein
MLTTVYCIPVRMITIHLSTANLTHYCISAKAASQIFILAKSYSNLITGLWGPEVSEKLWLPDSVTSAIEAARFSAIRTGRIYHRSILVLIFRGLVDPGSMELSDATEKISSDNTGDRSRNLPNCSAVPKPHLRSNHDRNRIPTVTYGISTHLLFILIPYILPFIVISIEILIM